MGRTLDLVSVATLQATRPEWAGEGSTFSMLWRPAQGDLALMAVAQRVDEVCTSLKVRVLELARVTAPQAPEHEAVYVRTEPMP